MERETSGRVNRAFEDVGPDGLIYCYGPQVSGLLASKRFVQVTSATALRIEHIEHGPAEAPCNDDPSAWSFGPAALAMVR